MTKLKDAQSVADVERGLVVASVEIAAPPERVFAALTTPEEVLRWWGAEGSFRVKEWNGDLRPGGKWSSKGTMINGNEFLVHGEYLEVDAPHKLVFTWHPMNFGGMETHVTYLLEPIDGGTRLTLRHEGFTGKPDVCRNHTNGWLLTFGWLAADLRSPVLHFLFRLLPPRATFAYDMTPEERQLMGVHVVYWRGKLAEGKIVAFGPVADPAGTWGVGILRVERPDEVDALTANDPVILSASGFRYEVLPMPQAVYA